MKHTVISKPLEALINKIPLDSKAKDVVWSHKAYFETVNLLIKEFRQLIVIAPVNIGEFNWIDFILEMVFFCHTKGFFILFLLICYLTLLFKKLNTNMFLLICLIW